MAKSKEKSEVEHLRGLVRQFKSEIRNLKKQLARYNKKEHLYNDIEDKIKDLEIQDEKKELINFNLCPKCSEKNLEYTDLGIRIIISCVCGYREINKKK